jgi:hypothetical protein
MSAGNFTPRARPTVDASSAASSAKAWAPGSSSTRPIGARARHAVAEKLVSVTNFFQRSSSISGVATAETPTAALSVWASRSVRALGLPSASPKRMRQNSDFASTMPGAASDDLIETVPFNGRAPGSALASIACASTPFWSGSSAVSPFSSGARRGASASRS